MKYDCTAGGILAEIDKDRLVPLLREVVAQLDGVDGPQGWIASLRFGAAGALANFGDIDGAVPVFRRLVTQNVQHAWAWIGLIDALHASGNAAAAVEAGRDAMGHLPGNRVLWNRTARALRDHEGPGAAASFFAPALGADASPGDLGFAISLFREAGQAGQAAQLCHRLLRTDPDASIAHMALIEAALADRDAAAARAAARAALARSPEHLELRLRIAQGLFAAGEAAGALDVLDAMPPGAGFDVEARRLRARCELRLGETRVARVPQAEGLLAVSGRRADPEPSARPWPLAAELDAALAAGDAEASNSILERLLAAPGDLPWYVALRLVESARRLLSVDAADVVAAAFAGAEWSDADRQAFGIEQRRLRLGPRFALDWIWANRFPRRDPEGAERIGRVLLEGGNGKLAARYLRACCRRWPENGALRNLAALACEACGLDASGRLPSGGEGPSIQSLGRDGARSPRVGQIEACLLAGDLQQAEAELAQLEIEDGPLEAALICRPRATRIGSLLNEARILAAGGIDWTGDSVERLAPLVEGCFLPARRIVARLAAAPDKGQAGMPVPQTVHLVWPSSAPPSREAVRLFEAWRRSTRREVGVQLVQDCAGALQEAGGDAALRAFRLTQDDAQKADLLRFALAVIHGGAIITADQWPSGTVDTLFDSAQGALVFRDADGSVSLDALVTAPGHPLVRDALTLVVASCLAGDNDHRWFKTGPGLMTRAVARHLLQPERGDASVRLRSIGALRRQMHRHATVIPSPARAASDTADTGLALALARFTEGAGPAGPHAS